MGLPGDSAAFGQVDKGALVDYYLDCFALEGLLRPETAAFREQFKAMHLCNKQGRRFSKWMAATFQACMADWATRLEAVS